MTLKFKTGAGQKVTIQNPSALVQWYNGSSAAGKPNVKHGPRYYTATSPKLGQPDAIGFADLPWAVLLDGRPHGDSAEHLLTLGPVSIAAIPTAVPLHASTAGHRQSIGTAIQGICGWRTGCPIASKMMHPKRREIVPVLDNQAIFGTFAHHTWQKWDSPMAVPTVKTATMVAPALELIFDAVSDEANAKCWKALEKAWPQYTRIQLFDQCWWACLRGGAAVRASGGVS